MVSLTLYSQKLKTINSPPQTYYRPAKLLAKRLSSIALQLTTSGFLSVGKVSAMNLGFGMNTAFSVVWLLSHTILQDSPNSLAAAYQKNTNGGTADFRAIAFDVNKNLARGLFCAVLPAWKAALLNVFISHAITLITVCSFHANCGNQQSEQYSAVANLGASQRDMTNSHIPPLNPLTPGSRAHPNEVSASHRVGIQSLLLKTCKTQGDERDSDDF